MDRLRGAALFQAGPGAVIDLDPNGIIRGWNPMAERILGQAARDVWGRAASFLLPDRPDEEAMAALSALARSPEAAPLVVNYRRPDGGIRHIAYNAVPLRETDGRVIGTTLVGRDLTAFHQAQATAMARLAGYRVLVEDAHEGIGAIDGEGRILWANARMAAMLGYPLNELVGLDIDAAIFSEDAEALAEFVARALQGTMDQTEIRLRRKDGSVLWAIVATAPFPGEVGLPGGVAGFFTDITDRKRAAAALQASEAEMRAYFEYAPVGVLLADVDGRIERVNPALCAITGYDRQELLGRPLSALVDPDRPTRTLSRLAGLFAGEESSFQVEQVFTSKAGRRMWLDILVSLMRDEQGAPLAFVAVVQDASPRKEAEQVKNEFVAVTSHELRTPLTSIRGALGLLTGGVVGELPESARRMLDIAVQSTDRLIRLVNDILDLERLTSGKLSLSLETCEAAGLISRAVAEMRGAADAAEVTIRAASMGSEGSMAGRVWADPDRIIQALTNLLGNAIKFSPRGGVVEVRTRADDDVIVFAIEDQGPGIPGDQLETVFERFQQVDGSDAREKGGTGLGLTICRTIVEQHGGRIWAESVLGAGATFYFTLPVVADIAPEPPDDPGLAPGVLVCDDDAAVREVVTAMLEASGYRVWTATSGEEALMVARSRHPDVIVLDLILPGIDGRETAVRLKDQPGTGDIPIVVLSVLTAEEMPVEGSVSRVDKPVAEDALFEALRQALAGARRQALVVEDDPELAEVLTLVLARHGLAVRGARSGREAKRLSRRLMPDLLVLDLALSGEDAFSLVDWMREQRWSRTVPVLVYTAFDLTDADRNRLRLGETRFLTKGRTAPELFETTVDELLGWMERGAARR